MKGILIIALIISFLAAFTFSCGGSRAAAVPATPTPDRSNDMANTNTANRPIPLSESDGGLGDSVWGGTGISLTVLDSSVEIDLDCAHLLIHEAPDLSRDRKFEVVGSWTQETPGPSRDDRPPQTTKVNLTGRVQGTKMDLRISAIKDGNELGRFTLERGRSGQVRKCR